MMVEFSKRPTGRSLSKSGARVGASAVAGAGLIARAFFPTHAFALPPDATFSATAWGASPLNIFVPGTVSGFGAFGTDSATTKATLSASVAGSSGDDFAQSSASVEYFGEVVGSSPTPVPLSIIGSLSSGFDTSGTTGIPGGGSGAQIFWGQAVQQNGLWNLVSGSPSVSVCAGPIAPCTPESGSLNATFSIDSGQIFEVSLNAAGDASGGASYSASADPMISILPSFLADHPGLSLEFSANISQPGAVGSIPEPSTWAMLMTGFSALAFAGFRRRSPANEAHAQAR
jgi:hypothetical protein